MVFSGFMKKKMMMMRLNDWNLKYGMWSYRYFCPENDAFFFAQKKKFLFFSFSKFDTIHCAFSFLFDHYVNRMFIENTFIQIIEQQPKIPNSSLIYLLSSVFFSFSSRLVVLFSLSLILLGRSKISNFDRNVDEE